MPRPERFLARVLDVVMISGGALTASQFEFNHLAKSQVDATYIAFSTALALALFTVLGVYQSSGRRSMYRLLGSVSIAWLVDQACCFALLYVLHRIYLVSSLWFLYWTIISGLGLLLVRPLSLGVWKLLARIAIRRPRTTFQISLEPSAMHADVPPIANPVRRAIKRGFDVICTVPLLFVLAPLFVVVALLVRRDGGPITFGHERIGQHGRKFRCYKFRTMVVNADVVLRELLANDPQVRSEWERDFKLKNDVRVTAVGLLLRRTSLDELPQLWNVLRGDMSLVGPRPVTEKELDRYGEEVSYYLMAKPGITGLWQVSGRNDIEYAKRVSLDVLYVQHWSLLQDVVILIKTVGVVMRRNGAY